MDALDSNLHPRYHNLLTPTKRVITVAPMPPEKSAYALARYSRSPDSIRDSIAWVRTHDSQKFLESFYFQYGHASIADLGHTVLCFEGISELAATEIEEEPLWDGQAKSSRYQDFSRSGFVTPPELTPTGLTQPGLTPTGLTQPESAPTGLRPPELSSPELSSREPAPTGLTPPELSPADGAAYQAAYQAAGGALLAAYGKVQELALACLAERLPRPADMPPASYRRNLAARAFDVARYLLFWGVPTNVGQVTSIRTLEKQIRRLRASEYGELRELGEEMSAACAAQPDCLWDPAAAAEPLAPTLARHAEADWHAARSREDLKRWAEQNLPPRAGVEPGRVDLLRPEHVPADIAATLLYPMTDRPFRELYELARGWSERMRGEVLDVALGSRTRRDEILGGFRGGLYAYDLTIDIGAYRDLHRHRRCQKFRQSYAGKLGYDTPALVSEAGAAEVYDAAMRAAFDTLGRLPAPGAHYLLPFGARSRFLFKMDFAEAEYMARLRSGVKGHFSYRQIAWEMKCKMDQLEPELGRLIEATPPWVEDPLRR
jgi:thymidylate synthase ThyX